MITDKLGNISGIRIQNFRLFKNEYFDFSPITVLVGPNSSGKSSFIKSLLLLKNKKEGYTSSNTSGLDFSNLEHQLGDISYCIEEKENLIFELFFNPDASIEYSINKDDEIVNKKLKYRGSLVLNMITYKRHDKDPEGNEYTFTDWRYECNFYVLFNYLSVILSSFKKKKLEEYNDILEMTEEGKFKINELKNEYEYYGNKGYYLSPLFDEHILLPSSFNYLEEALDEFRKYVIKNDGALINVGDDINRYNRVSASLLPETPMLNNMLPEELVKYFISNYPEFFPIYNSHGLISGIGNTNLMYVPALKGLHKRYLPINDDSALSKMIEYDKMPFRKGKLSWVYQAQSNAAGKYIHFPSVDFEEKWLEKFNIGSKIKMVKDRLRGIKYVDLDGGSLVDKGYGLTQLATVIISISDAIRSEGTVILEEPEVNLHPKFQSMLAEMILHAKKFYNVSFIIETHSEYLIRKLQYLTAKKELSPNDTVIYYFHHPDEIPKGEKQIKKLTIRADGMMDGDFGKGFFDESARLTMDLLKIQSQN